MLYHKIGGGFYSLRNAKDFAILYRELARENNLGRIENHVYIKPVRTSSSIIWEVLVSDVLKEISEAYFNRPPISGQK